MGEAPRILFSTGALYIFPLQWAFDLAQSAGCDGLEIDVCPQTLLCRPPAIARLAAESGLPVRAVHPPLLPLPGWKQRDALVHLIDLALTLEAPTIIIHPPKAKRLDAPQIAECRAQIAEAQRQLQGTGTQVVIENPGFFHPSDRQNALWHLPTLRRFADECGLYMAFDTTHAGSSPLTLLESYEFVVDRLAHVHLSDLRTPPRLLDRRWLCSYVKHHQLPGEGQLPLDPFLRRLAGSGYRGDITLELSPVCLRIWDLAYARRCLTEVVRWTRAALAAPRTPAEPSLGHASL